MRGVFGTVARIGSHSAAAQPSSGALGLVGAIALLGLVVLGLNWWWCRGRR